LKSHQAVGCSTSSISYLSIALMARIASWGEYAWLQSTLRLTPYPTPSRSASTFPTSFFGPIFSLNPSYPSSTIPTASEVTCSAEPIPIRPTLGNLFLSEPPRSLYTGTPRLFPIIS
jgi:hypothetical protein